MINWVANLDLERLPVFKELCYRSFDKILLHLSVQSFIVGIPGTLLSMTMMTKIFEVNSKAKVGLHSVKSVSKFRMAMIEGMLLITIGAFLSFLLKICQSYFSSLQ